MVSKYLTNIIASGMQIVKGIDAVTREQLVRVMSLLGVQNVTPVFSMVPTVGPFKPAALIPTITEEDEVILNNVRMVVEFLTAGSSLSRTSDQVMKNSLLKVMIFIFVLFVVVLFNKRNINNTPFNILFQIHSLLLSKKKRYTLYYRSKFIENHKFLSFTACLMSFLLIIV